MHSYEQIELFEYVSFDLFDTLVFRTFSKQSDVFKYVEYVYNKTYRRIIRGFCVKREKAEKRARRKRSWGEVNLNEIYDELVYSVEVKNILKNLEIQTEIDNCIPNEEVVNLARKCHDRGQKVIIITDMYLPRKCIESIVKKCNILVENIFISGEIKKTKIQGELFDYVLNALSISKDQIIHLGDNEISDYRNSLLHNISAIQYIRKKIDFPYLLKMKHDLFISYFNNLIENGYPAVSSDSSEYKIGYSVMGPIITEFCLWLHQMKETCNIDKLFFLAREGYMIKQCYETLYPQEKNTTFYVRLNKRVMGLSLITKENIDDILFFLFKNYKNVSLREFINFFGVNQFLSQKVLDNFLVEMDIEERINVKNSSDIIINILQPIINEQSRLLEKYICSFDITGKKIGLVNNSYSGNGQALLKKFIKEHNLDCKLLGLQFAANKRCKKILGKEFTTWIPSNKKDSLKAYLFERGSLIFEHLLFEPNGTALRLMEDSQGAVYIVCEHPRNEVKDFERINAAQMGMADFVAAYKKCIRESAGFEVIGYFINMIQKPEKQDALTLGSLFDDDINEDRQIIDFHLPFDKKILYKNNIYNKISWVQGYLKGIDTADIYRKIFNARLWLTNLSHIIKGI